MNEIEYAITNFEEFLEADIGQGDLHMCSVDIALAALREQAERNKGCYHCINSSKKIFAKKERYSDASETGIAYETIRVVFCPQCGKRLEVEP